MKKLLFVCVCLLLVGCTNSDDSNPAPGTDSYPNAYKEEGDDFLYELEVSPTKIASGGEINIVAKLTYIGDEDEIVISHKHLRFILIYMKHIVASSKLVT